MRLACTALVLSKHTRVHTRIHTDTCARLLGGEAQIAVRVDEGRREMKLLAQVVVHPRHVEPGAATE